MCVYYVIRENSIKNGIINNNNNNSITIILRYDVLHNTDHWSKCPKYRTDVVDRGVDGGGERGGEREDIEGDVEADGMLY